MRRGDIYDNMPNGPAQRRYNKLRLAELERDGAARRARIATVVDYAELGAKSIQPRGRHLL